MWRKVIPIHTAVTDDERQEADFLRKYRELFVHRDDVFSEQQPSGAYFPVREAISDDDLQEHLAGLASYGVYVIRPEDQSVKYVVFDLDTHDEESLRNLLAQADCLVGSVRFDLRCLLLERSGSKGSHIWLFLDKPLPARQVRAWVLSSFTPRCEMFPKQGTVEPGGFGNLVKLPLGVHAVSGGRSEFVPVQGWASGVDDVVPLDARLVPAVPVTPPVGGGLARASRPASSGAATGNRGGEGATSPFPCIDHISRVGVGTGYRDRAMFHLALYYYGHGLDKDLAEEACLRANANFEPPMTEREVRDKVSSAYRGRFASAKCGSDWLVEVCPGPCKEGWSVRKAEAGALKKAQPGDTIDLEVIRITRADKTRILVGHPDAQNQPTLVLK